MSDKIEVRESSRVKQFREMAQASESNFKGLVKAFDEDNQLWRAIYHAWNFRRAAGRMIIPNDIDQEAVDAKINNHFVESLVKLDEAKAVANEANIDISDIVRPAVNTKPIVNEGIFFHFMCCGH